MAGGKSSFLAGIFTRRKQVQKGVSVRDVQTLLPDLGYDLKTTPDGQLVPIRSGEVDYDTSVDNFHSRWSSSTLDSVDLVASRSSRLKAYKKMDKSGAEGSVVLDVIADEVVNIGDSSEASLVIEINDKNLREKVMAVLESNNVLTSVRADIRSLCKSGDFSYTVTRRDGSRLVPELTEGNAGEYTSIKSPFSKDDLSVVFRTSETYELEASRSRIYEMILEDPTEPGGTKGGDKFFPWEYALFSIASRDTFPYGLSELEKMRVPWEKLTILEDLLAITRANRLDKIAITVPGLRGDPSSVLNRLSQLKNSLRNILLGGSGARISRNQDTSLVDYLWIPEGFDAKKLSTSLEVSSIEDVEYFRDKLINASRLPKGFFLASEGQGQQRPLSLRQQDIKFARSLIPIGEAYCLGLKKLITLLALYLGGDVSKTPVRVYFKKSPYISGELMQTYKDAYDLVSTYKELKGTFSEQIQITDIEVKKLLDLIGMPHGMMFPDDQESAQTTERRSFFEAAGQRPSYSSILEAAASDTTCKVYH